ncbi:MAG TPA: prepilin-type N-terminal cleavage/methylation domain-containing protein [Longimicrobiales bacterium]
MDRAADRDGFTLVEVALVLTIAAVLIGFAVPQIQRGGHMRDVRGARDGVQLMGARARARAMEQARTVEFHLDVAGATAAIVEGGDTLERFAFGEELDVTATSSVEELVLCYTSRGFASEPCSTSIGDLEVVFERAGHEASLEIWQLGQMRKL